MTTRGAGHLIAVRRRWPAALRWPEVACSVIASGRDAVLLELLPQLVRVRVRIRVRVRARAGARALLGLGLGLRVGLGLGSGG